MTKTKSGGESDVGGDLFGHPISGDSSLTASGLGGDVHTSEVVGSGTSDEPQLSLHGGGVKEAAPVVDERRPYHGLAQVTPGQTYEI